MNTSARNQAPNANDSDHDEDMDISDEEGGITVDGIYIPPPPPPYCSLENKGPRLMITHISNNFFKSYANDQVVGPFHKCFNAVVGPNGSGKSNVIDSLLFVFGFRASKIRSKKISVLLHNSELYPMTNSCTVSVHFTLIVDKEGDDYEIVPGSEFVVARSAFRDNSSYYTLNGKKTHFKEIGVLLKSHGIDLDHNRFLILQGEVEQISLMKPKGDENESGMLEYLEDIIGTARYKVPLSQLAQRVDLLSEQRSERLNRLKLVENELSELQGPMQEAVEFLELENKITNRKNFYYQKVIYDTKQKSEDVMNELQEQTAIQQEFTDKLAQLAQQKESKVNSLKEASGKYENLQKRKDALTEAFNKANNNDVQLQAEMTQLNTNRKKTKELLAAEIKKLDKLKRLPEETVKNIADYENGEQKAVAKKEAIEEEKSELLANMQNETKELQEKQTVIQTKLIGLNNTVDEMKSAFTLAEQELKLCLSSQESEQKKLAHLAELRQSSEAKIEQYTSETEKLKQFLPEKEERLNKANRDLLAIRTRDVEVIANMRRNRSILEEKKAAMQASTSRGRVLDALMQQKALGKCPGFFGRLGDLGAIDAKYDVAVSTACGPLDNMVVDTVDTAQWCLEFLKNHNIGRTTIIALDKQEHLRPMCNARVQTPENVPRLFDLIRTADDRFRPAFYYGLRDTLVAQDLEQARRIAYGAKRYRTVSLQGDIIEMSGTMSGGGRQVSRGRMGQTVAAETVNPREVEAMEVQVVDLENELRQMHARQGELESEIQGLGPEVKEMKIALQKYSLELQSLKEQRPNLLKQLKVQEDKAKSTKADPATVKKLTKDVEQKKACYDAASAKADVVQKQADKLGDEIKQKTQGRVQAVDKRLRDVMKQIEKFKSEITKLRVGIKTAERDATKSADRISTMEKDIANAEDRLRAMKADRETIEEDAKKMLECIKQISENMDDGSEEFSDLKNEVTRLTKMENELKSEKIDIDEKCKTLKKEVNIVQREIEQWLHKVSQLHYQEIPDQSMEEMKTYTQDELTERDAAHIMKEIRAYEEQFKSAKPNLNAITEYKKKRDVYTARSKELEEVCEKRKQMRDYHESLHTRRKEEFITGYNIIKMKLKEMYQMITLGGDADFEMLDSFDPFNEGIQFRVRPPKKTWKIISNLSGGEKTLSSLALVFALHYYKPSPLYVMDEIDAALDFKNVSIVGNYIKERTKNAQFIIISLRSNMFELCDHLIGIYKTFNNTKTVCVDPRIYDKNENKENVPAPNSQPLSNNNQNCSQPLSNSNQPLFSQPY